ncbi:hypothetical protein M3N64_04335 [Sporolactobacillus sp. CPB3-1]|uniref:Uncharacterized protein n=1 Tax=Sporolactobacillus mangiferae TaxID=2940498 RepID=A0ABT0M8H6_9BACL|nr:hypothetical protein [Sporolactobacillus mangiferae]MCL1631175.1 hypothetical protein [Sporolactobacillus mangiferae]
MARFAFYHESIDNRTISDAYNKPTAIIEAADIEAASERFCQKYVLKQVDLEKLPEGEYRLYTRTTRPIWHRQEHVYDITSAD